MLTRIQCSMATYPDTRTVPSHMPNDTATALPAGTAVHVVKRFSPGCRLAAYVDGQPRTHHVRARARCRLRRLSREALLGFLETDPLLFAKLAVGLAQLLTFRFRSAVEELEPVRSFAAALREPMDFEEVAPQFHELDAPLPEEDPDAGPAPPTGPAEAMKVMRKVARKRRKKGGSAGV